jgi:hypothetical protein
VANFRFFKEVRPMQLTSKKLSGLFFGTLALFGLLVLFICLPSNAFGATGTLGSESPEIYCTYFNEDGSEVDGNNLKAGTYDVSINLKGMASASVIQVTATYSEDATVSTESSYLLSDTVTDMKSMGYLIDDENIVFGFVSDNDSCSDILSEGTVLATISVTFANDCDADDVISISSNPNLTFVIADYGDGYDNEYALDTEFADYNGTLYLMTCDVTPSNGYTVDGSIVVATSSTGATSGKAAYGEYTMTVYSDEERTNVVSTVQSVYDNTEKTNTFSLLLPTGTYYATLEYDYALTRDDITITVSNENIADVQIPVVACNISNSDTNINVNDVSAVKTGSINPDAYPYCDLNADDLINVNDVVIAKSLAFSTIELEPINIK